MLAFSSALVGNDGLMGEKWCMLLLHDVISSLVYKSLRTRKNTPCFVYVHAVLTFRRAWCWQGSEDGEVRIWDIVEAKVTRSLKHHTRPVCSLSYHPSEPMLLTASYDGSAVLWGP